MIVVCQVLFNPSKPLVTAMAPLFFHDENNSCLEAGQQVVISSVGGSCSYVLEGGRSGYDAEPMTAWQARDSN
jgi:hypothetical protein